jgi:hypothetical protein
VLESVGEHPERQGLVRRERLRLGRAVREHAWRAGTSAIHRPSSSRSTSTVKT